MAAKSKKSGASAPVKKSSAKKSAPVKSKKSTAKKNGSGSAAAKPTVKLRTVKLTNADGTKRTVKRPVDPVAHGRGGAVRDPRFTAAAERASELACTDGTGAPTNRARIGTNQIAKLATVVDKSTAKSARALIATVVGENQSKSMTILTGYADSRIGRGDLPDGTADRLRAIATAIGDPTKHKLSGLALAAALVGLAENPADKSAAKSGSADKSATAKK